RADLGVDVFAIAQIGGGYERDRSIDDLLTLGNQRQERTHAMARSIFSPRVVVDATYERAIVDRGVQPLLFRIRYTQAMTTGSIPLARERRAIFTAGEFNNRSFLGDEWHQYVGLSFAGTLAGALRLSMTARRERTMSDLARLRQYGYYTIGELDYRLRLFTFTFEYRY